MTRSAFKIDPARAEEILDERTAALATRFDERTTEPEDVLSVLIVLAAGQRYALAFHMLASALPERALHPLPVEDDAVIGAVHERGELWIVYSLAAIVGATAAGGTSGRILLIERPGPRAAIMVDAVEGTAAIDRKALNEIGADDPSPGGALIRLAATSGLMVLDETALSDRLDLARRSHS